MGRAARAGGAALGAITLFGGCAAITGVDNLVETSPQGDAGSTMHMDGGGSGDATVSSDATTRDATRDSAAIVNDAPGDSVRDSRPADGSNDAASCAPMLLFDEEFDGGTLDTTTRWTAAGDGVWFIEGGVGVQSNPNATAAVLFAQAFSTATDYRIVARMASTGPFGIGQDLAPEVAFRTDPAVDAGGIPATYHCNFDLLADEIVLQQTLPAGTPQLSDLALSLPSTFDAATPFVLDVTVQGTEATCSLTIDGLGEVGTVGTNHVTRLNGTFGLKVYETTATFDYIRVYALGGCE